MSTHEIAIIEIGDILPHPNADKMEITSVWGWHCCVGKGQFKKGDRAIYIPPDYVVPTTHPAFAFLKKEGSDKERITVKRLRGLLSQGLIISVPDELSHLNIGDNVIDMLGIERYEESIPSGAFVHSPRGLYLPTFDVESYQRYINCFIVGEEIVATEKIHGENARYTFATDPNTGDIKQFCGSRTTWLSPEEGNVWWTALEQHPAIGEWCKANPEKTLFGEIFGNIRQKHKIKYGAKENQIFFAAFAILNKQFWMDYDEMIVSLGQFGIPSVPLLYRGPFDEQKLLALAEGNSRWPGANHMAEGTVIVPVKERMNVEIGRVCLKMVSNRFLEKG